MDHAAVRSLLAMRALSVSRPLLPLFEGVLRKGCVLGAGYLQFDGYVVAVTAPGAPRMPNGVECHLRPERGATVWIGEGRLEAGGRSLLLGPVWNPIPTARVRLAIEPR